MSPKPWGCEEPHVTCQECGHVWCLGEQASRCDHGWPICEACWPGDCVDCQWAKDEGWIP